MIYELEKYTGNKSRFTCPACGSRHCFARYQNTSGEYLSDEIGRCNRESKCGYHKKPKDFFFENPPNNQLKKKRGARQTRPAQIKNAFPITPDYIEREMLLKTLTNYDNNSFVKFLLELFPEDSEAVEKAIRDYLVGTTRDGKTVFWQTDDHRRVRTGKIIAYDSTTGKRRKDINPNWVHSELKKTGKIKTDFNLRQCFFGEHLLTIDKEKPIAIVEAEKTAVIASICFSEFVWLACGAKRNINAVRLQRFGNREIILYPDADGFDIWQEIAGTARLYGARVQVSDLLEQSASETEKQAGYDLADYLISEQRQINRHNEHADDYNAALSLVLNDEKLADQVFALIGDNRDADAIRQAVFNVARGRTSTTNKLQGR